MGEGASQRFMSVKEQSDFPMESYLCYMGERQGGKLVLWLASGKKNRTGYNRIMIHLDLINLLSNCLYTQSLTHANLSSNEPA